MEYLSIAYLLVLIALGLETVTLATNDITDYWTIRRIACVLALIATVCAVQSFRRNRRRAILAVPVLVLAVWVVFDAIKCGMW